jgi:hypothetical protein
MFLSHNLYTVETLLLTLWEEHTVGVENEMLFKIFECNERNIGEVREKYVLRKSAISTENGAKSRELRSDI